ncbi:MAG: DUF4493 domain-containing protein [Cyclobacteriaceae bacterium]
MKYLYMLLSMGFILLSCNRQDQESPEPTDFGYLSMNISVSITEEPASGRVEAVPTDDWKVSIFNASDDSEAAVFDPYSTAPTEIQLPTGEYYIEAHSNNFQEAAFENPYYFGRSENFTIDKEELKTIDIDAELANTKVAINYSANVTSTFNDYTGAVTVVSTGTTLPYVQGEIREGYFVAEALSVVVDLSYTKLDGSFITRQFTANIDAQPKTLYNINVDAVLEDGKIVININVDETFTEEVIELGDAEPDPNANWIAGEDWIDSRDGEVYGTVQIGDQVWMSENLRYLPEIQNNSEWTTAGNTGEKAYGVFAYDGNDVEIAITLPEYESYGVLYNWWSAMDSQASSGSVPSGVQGACPANWHLPSQTEWFNLSQYLGGSLISGGKLKEIGTQYWLGPNVGATNEIGFNARGASGRGTGGGFGLLGRSGAWFSSTESAIDRVNVAQIYNDRENLFTVGLFKAAGFSIRCVKD